jgi:hypothetical protein
MQELPRYFELTRFALIEITGSEAFAFLNQQITGDLNDINSRGWMFSAWCQANGRVICTFMVFKHNHSLFLILPAAMKDRIIRRLNMYVLRSDVRIRDASGDYVLLGLLGINIMDTDIFGSGTRIGKMLATESCCVLEQWGLTLRGLMVCKNDTLAMIMEKIQRVCKKGEDSGWNLLDIEAGIPWITEPTSESFLPQMLNLDDIQGLSYQKGCYPGQEVIARLHYRGELKRRLLLGEGRGETIPAPGTALERADTGARTGDVIDAACHPDGGYKLLVIVDINEATAPMRLQDTPQTSITLQTLHYPEYPAA